MEIEQKQNGYGKVSLACLYTHFTSELFRGGTPLYKLYRYVPPHRVGFLHCFGLKTGIHFAHFGLESGMVFGGTTGRYQRIYRFNSE